MKKKIIVTLFIIISSCFSYTQGQSETYLQSAAHPAGKGEFVFNFKMKEKWKVSINIKIVKSKICN